MLQSTEQTSCTSFNNIPARSRAQREAVRDKESWEKDRLKQRKGGHVRVDTSVTGSAMLVYAPESQGFMSDSDRFHTDTAGEYKHARDEKLARKNILINAKRQEHVDREVHRWQHMTDLATQDEEKWNQLRKSGTKARRNKCGEAFNLITLQYNDGKDGERLKQADHNTRTRATIRAQNLQYQNSREGINPITGDAISRIPNNYFNTVIN